MKIADRVNPDLLAACRAIDAETTDAALRELDRRQSGWLGIPEPEYVQAAERVMMNFLLRGNALVTRKIIEYIDARFAEQQFSGMWTTPNGLGITADVGYAHSWWETCMKPELLKIMAE